MEAFILLGCRASLSGLDHLVIAIIIILTVVSLIIGYASKNRKISFLNAFLFSFFCTPLVGIIIVILSKKLIKCPYCDYETYENFEFCPECGKNMEGLLSDNIPVSAELS
jgi:hypothetical protein